MLTLEGLLDREMAALLVEQLSELGPEDRPVTLDLTLVDLEDAAVTALLVDALRQTARRVGELKLLRPPQVLAHSLYRVGALGKSTLQLVEPRQELGI